MEKNKNKLSRKEKKSLAKKAEIEQKERYNIYKRLLLEEKKRKSLPLEIPDDPNNIISLKNVNKVYKNGYVQAAYDINLDINKNDFVVLVGPSGCGKSTTLRMIAGLEEITCGDLFIEGKYSNNTLPKDRDMAMVFQSYALYPHLTVYGNMAFSLKLRHFDKEEIYERVKNAAKILELEKYLDRKPKELSGGQRQRVALGRAIVRNANIYLMDEPLSNLDAKLRVQMRSEIVKLHNKLNATTIYVTHDQTEAMSMATKLVVMNAGRIQQIGSPDEIYYHPKNMFVSTFIGSPSTNLVEIKISNGSFDLFGRKISLTKEQTSKIDDFYNNFKKETQKQIDEEIENLKHDVLEDKKIKNKDEALKNLNSMKLSELNSLMSKINDEINSTAKDLVIGIRPECFKLSNSKDENSIQIKLEVAEMLGQEYFLHFTRYNKDIVCKINSKKKILAGDEVYITFDEKDLYIFDPISQNAIDL